MVAPDLSQITLAILAGGAGIRMGIPKSNLQLNHQPILAWLLDQINWPGPLMLVTSNTTQNPPGCDRFDQQAIDPVSSQGPLRGILTALQQTRTPLTCIATVDMPLIRADLLAVLIQNIIHQPRHLGIMFRLPGNQIQPFPSTFRPQAMPVIQHQLKSNQLSVQSLCNHPTFSTIPPPPETSPQVWTNLNHPQDLTLFQANLPLAKEPR